MRQHSTWRARAASRPQMNRWHQSDASNFGIFVAGAHEAACMEGYADWLAGSIDGGPRDDPMECMDTVKLSDATMGPPPR